MNTTDPIEAFKEGDFVIHTQFNRGLTTYIDQLSYDKTIATIRVGDTFVSVLVKDLKKYEPE